MDFADKFFRPFGYTEESDFERRALNVFWLVAFLIAWQFGAPYLNPLAPTPLGISVALQNLYNRGILEDVQVSTSVILWAAFVFALPMGCFLSYLYTIGFFRPLVSGVASLRNAPPAVLIVAFLLMQYGGRSLKIAVMAFIILVFFLSARIYAPQPKDEIIHGVCMRMSPWQILWHRVIRGKFHFALNDFVPCVGMGWAMLGMVEGLSRTEGGLGDLIMQTDKINNLDADFAIGLVGITIGMIITVGLRWFIKWKFPFAAQVAVTN